MRFIRDAVITIAIIIATATIFVYAAIARGGLSAEDQPGRVERTVARRLVRLSIPPNANHQTNPYAADPAAWRDADSHFDDHCAVCHGDDGRGHTEIGESMYPKVPDLASPAIQQLSDGDLFYVIQNGVRWTGMPGWRNEHSADETWKLVSFVRHVPSLAPAAAGEHEHGRAHVHGEGEDRGRD